MLTNQYDYIDALQSKHYVGKHSHSSSFLSPSYGIHDGALRLAVASYDSMLDPDVTHRRRKKTKLSQDLHEELFKSFSGATDAPATTTAVVVASGATAGALVAGPVGGAVGAGVGLLTSAVAGPTIPASTTGVGGSVTAGPPAHVPTKQQASPVGGLRPSDSAPPSPPSPPGRGDKPQFKQNASGRWYSTVTGKLVSTAVALGSGVGSAVGTGVGAIGSAVSGAVGFAKRALTSPPASSPSVSPASSATSQPESREERRRLVAEATERRLGRSKRAGMEYHAQPEVGAGTGVTPPAEEASFHEPRTQSYNLPSDEARSRWPEEVRKRYDQLMRDSGGKVAFRYINNKGYSYLFFDPISGKWKTATTVPDQARKEALDKMMTNSNLRAFSLPKGNSSEGGRGLYDTIEDASSKLQAQPTDVAVARRNQEKKATLRQRPGNASDSESTDDENKPLMSGGTPSKDPKNKPKKGRKYHI